MTSAEGKTNEQTSGSLRDAIDLLEEGEWEDEAQHEELLRQAREIIFEESKNKTP